MQLFTLTITQPRPPHRSRILPRIAVSVLILIHMAAVWAPVRAEVFDQYQVKAVFLYNLTNFITWPINPDLSHKAPFTIGVLGHDSLGAYLDQAVTGETVKGRQIRILRPASLDQLQTQSCQLLFVSADQMHLWPQIREITRANQIVTVGDVVGFGSRGGMITLLTAGRKIRIEINMEEMRGNGFKVSAKLLKLARIVTGGKEL